MSKAKHTNFLRQQAHKRVLSDGQGARKRKRHGKRRGIGSQRHKRALEMPA